MKFSIPTSAQIGGNLQRYARIAATVLAFGFVITTELAILLKDALVGLYNIAFEAGYNTGTFIHNLNNKLSAISVAIHEERWEELYEMIRIPSASNPAPVHYHNAAQIAEEMSKLTVRQLRELAGVKGKYKKQQLIEMMIATA